MKLTAKTLLFIALRFGQGMTLKETGKFFGMTRERVRQYEAKVLREVRKNGGIPQSWIEIGLCPNTKLTGKLEMK